MRLDLVDTPHGRCAILDDEGAGAALPPRDRTRELGRAALREALAMPDVAIPSDERGAPILPAGWLGSISHKAGRAAALTARDDHAGARIGVDLEEARDPRGPIEQRVLTAGERAALAAVDRRVITLAFAIKEAVYKAIDPLPCVRRYVAFAEVELALALDAPGACAVRVVDPARLPVAVEAWWCERDGHWLATARARAL